MADGAERNWYAQFNLAGHDGVDFDMPIGSQVHAVDDGKVVVAGAGAYGNTVMHPREDTKDSPAATGTLPSIAPMDGTGTQGRDHPVMLGLRETRYLKCFVLRVL